MMTNLTEKQFFDMLRPPSSKWLEKVVKKDMRKFLIAVIADDVTRILFWNFISGAPRLDVVQNPAFEFGVKIWNDKLLNLWKQYYQSYGHLTFFEEVKKHYRFNPDIDERARNVGKNDIFSVTLEPYLILHLKAVGYYKYFASKSSSNNESIHRATLLVLVRSIYVNIAPFLGEYLQDLILHWKMGIGFCLYSGSTFRSITNRSSLMPRNVTTASERSEYQQFIFEHHIKKNFAFQAFETLPIYEIDSLPILPFEELCRSMFPSFDTCTSFGKNCFSNRVMSSRTKFEQISVGNSGYPKIQSLFVTVGIHSLLNHSCPYHANVYTNWKVSSTRRNILVSEHLYTNYSNSHSDSDENNLEEKLGNGEDDLREIFISSSTGPTFRYIDFFFSINHVPGDGSCFYHCLLSSIPIPNCTSDNLRDYIFKEVARVLRNETFSTKSTLLQLFFFQMISQKMKLNRKDDIEAMLDFLKKETRGWGNEFIAGLFSIISGIEIVRFFSNEISSFHLSSDMVLVTVERFAERSDDIDLVSNLYKYFNTYIRGTSSVVFILQTSTYFGRSESICVGKPYIDLQSEMGSLYDNHFIYLKPLNGFVDHDKFLFHLKVYRDVYSRKDSISYHTSTTGLSCLGCEARKNCDERRDYFVPSKTIMDKIIDLESSLHYHE